MNTINERIAFLIKDQGLTQAKFAEMFHFGQSNVSKICNGTVTPTDSLIDAICTKLNVSLAWLEDGVGEMYVQRSANEELALLVSNIMSDADDSFRKRFISLLMALPPEKWAAIESFVEELQKNLRRKIQKTRERLTVPGFSVSWKRVVFFMPESTYSKAMTLCGYVFIASTRSRTRSARIPSSQTQCLFFLPRSSFPCHLLRFLRILTLLMTFAIVSRLVSSLGVLPP